MYVELRKKVLTFKTSKEEICIYYIDNKNKYQNLLHFIV